MTENWITTAASSMDAVFNPYASFSEEGDSLRFVVKDEPHFRRRVDDVLTVYESESDRSFCGGYIKGVKQLLASGDGQIDMSITRGDEIHARVVVMAYINKLMDGPEDVFNVVNERYASDLLKSARQFECVPS